MRKVFVLIYIAVWVLKEVIINFFLPVKKEHFQIYGTIYGISAADLEAEVKYFNSDSADHIKLDPNGNLYLLNKIWVVKEDVSLVEIMSELNERTFNKLKLKIRTKVILNCYKYEDNDLIYLNNLVLI